MCSFLLGLGYPWTVDSLTPDERQGFVVTLSRRSGDHQESRLKGLVVEDGQIELVKAVRVTHDVDLGDLPAPDREGHEREQLSSERADQPSGAIDEYRTPEQAEVRESLRLTSYLLRATHFDGRGVDSQNHLRIEDGDKPVEVTVLRSRDKGIDNAALNLHLGIRCNVPLLKPAACATGKLASCIGSALHDRRDLIEGHPEDIVQHERDAFDRRKGFKHYKQCQADHVAQ
jgi:hypothetical protein